MKFTELMDLDLVSVARIRYPGEPKHLEPMDYYWDSNWGSWVESDKALRRRREQTIKERTNDGRTK